MSRGGHRAPRIGGVVDATPTSSARRLRAVARHLSCAAGSSSPEQQRLAVLPKQRWKPAVQALVPGGDGPGERHNVFNVLANHPTFFAAWRPFAAFFGNTDALTEGGYTRPLQLAIARTGWLLRCEYVWRSYITHGVREGGNFTDADISALQAGPADPHWAAGQPLDRAAIQAADDLLNDGCVSDTTWEQLEAHGLSELEQRMDLVAGVGAYALNSMLCSSLGVPCDDADLAVPSDFAEQHSSRAQFSAVPPSVPRPSAPRIAPRTDREFPPNNLNIFRTLSRHPRFQKAWSSLGGHVLSARSESGTQTLSERVRELVILRTGWLLNAAYEWHQHVRIAQEWGLVDADFRALEVGPSSAHWSEEERAALRAVDELRGVGCVSDATWAELVRVGFTVEQRVDIIAAVGQYTLVSFMLNSFGIQLEDHFEVAGMYGKRYVGSDGRWAPLSESDATS